MAPERPRNRDLNLDYDYVDVIITSSRGELIIMTVSFLGAISGFQALHFACSCRTRPCQRTSQLPQANLQRQRNIALYVALYVKGLSLCICPAVRSRRRRALNCPYLEFVF